MTSMTEEFYNVADKILENDDRTAVILGVSGVGICVDLSKKYPGRFIDAGIMEQAIVGISSGMSIAGMIPIVYGQSTFFIERAYEQLKIDFGYQNVSGNFVLYGGSTEFGTLGATHCCPAALTALTAIPNLEVVVPGRPEEFTSLFMSEYDNGRPTVFRISRFANAYNEEVSFGKANIVKKGSKATIVAVGPMLELAMRALGDEDVTILYYTTVAPFDGETLIKNITNDKILLMEPSYRAGLMPIIAEVVHGRPIQFEFVGYPHELITNHGLVTENAEMYGLDVNSVRGLFSELVNR